jgi:hypothetical protein
MTYYLKTKWLLQYMKSYCLLKHLKFCILPTERTRIYVFPMIVRIHSDCFTKTELIGCFVIKTVYSVMYELNCLTTIWINSLRFKVLTMWYMLDRKEKTN